MAAKTFIGKCGNLRPMPNVRQLSLPDAHPQNHILSQDEMI